MLRPVVTPVLHGSYLVDGPSLELLIFNNLTYVCRPTQRRTKILNTTHGIYFQFFTILYTLVFFFTATTIAFRMTMASTPNWYLYHVRFMYKTRTGYSLLRPCITSHSSIAFMLFPTCTNWSFHVSSFLGDFGGTQTRIFSRDRAASYFN